jgi:hypothetical protein
MPRHGEAMVNMTRVSGRSGVSAEELSQAELESREQVFEAADFLRQRVPGYSKSYLLQAAAQSGVRESRHIVGRYTLTAEDVLEGRNFPDSIGRGAFPIDLHAPEGSGLVARLQRHETWCLRAEKDDMTSRSW